MAFHSYSSCLIGMLASKKVPHSQQKDPARVPRRRPLRVNTRQPTRRARCLGGGRYITYMPRRRSPNDDDGDAIVVPPHPHGVRPHGSRLMSDDGRSLREIPGALGRFQALTDEVMLQILASAGTVALARCGCVSHAMRVLAMHEDLWRAYYLEELPAAERLCYHKGGWRSTYLARAQACGGSSESCAASRPEVANVALRPLPPYYSDTLYAPWHCGTAALPARWTRVQNIERVCASALSIGEFEERFERTGVPVIITGLVPSWPAFTAWREEALGARFKDEVRACGACAHAHTCALPGCGAWAASM